MTRLKSADISHIVAELGNYDDTLIKITGRSLRGIACYATGFKETSLESQLDGVLVGVIPISTGKGIIGGFSDAVAGIAAHIGCRTFVTRNADVAGLCEAFEKRADLVLMSDDNCFVAVNVQRRRVVENADATGKGFAAGLALMAGGLKERKVLVLGCGPVGSSAAETLIQRGALVAVHDLNRFRCQILKDKIKELYNAVIDIEEELDPALVSYHYIIDATPAAAIISRQHIHEDTYVSAPGVPLGLDAEAEAKMAGRLLHDPLQIGVATMLIEAIRMVK